ncbi:hypothetical protein BH10ACT3_BH10ACT3_16660 [soil metagenome]
MSHLLVLGGGWVGTAVARAAEGRVGTTVVDPPLEPTLRDRDRAAAATLAELLVSTGTTAVINACGRVHGDDDEMLDANVAFPRWLCEVLAGSRTRLVHIGSASEYGDPGAATPVTEDTPLRPEGAYATSKAAGSAVVVEAADGGLETIVARVFNIVGAPIPAASPLHRWREELVALPPEGGDIEVWWPDTIRDFVALDDVARALIGLALDDPADAADVNGSVLNVCSGVGVSFGQIVAAMADQLGIAAQVRSLDRPGIPAVVGDPGRLRARLGWVPDMSASRLAELATADLRR